MRPRSYLSLLAALLLCCAMNAGTEPAEILLWPNGAPGSEGKSTPEKVRISDQQDIVLSGIHKPSVTPYFPDAKMLHMPLLL